MTTLIDYLRKPFEFLSAHTSDETSQHGVYADTRSEGGHFSIASTQSGVSAYAAHEAENVREMPGSVLPQELETYDCEDPQTCPTCQSTVADD